MIDDRSRFYAEIRELRGVWAVGRTLEESRHNLPSTLEGWFVLRLRRNLPGRYLTTRVVASKIAYDRFVIPCGSRRVG